jgi:hypothetical protein
LFAMVFSALPSSTTQHTFPTKVMAPTPALIARHSSRSVKFLAFDFVEKYFKGFDTTTHTISANLVCLFPQGRKGWNQFLKLQPNDTYLYVVYSVDGYAFVGPGLLETYIQANTWLWRVTCTEGALVRAGLDLSTQHLVTLPFGAILQVKRKTVNAMGFSRLQINAIIAEPILNNNTHDDNDIDRMSLSPMAPLQYPFQRVTVEGW